MRGAAIVTDVRSPVGAAIASILTGHGLRVLGAGDGRSNWDIADLDACHGFVAEVERATGPVAILVNNAAESADAAFTELTPDQWRRLIAANIGGYFNMVRAVWPGMLERQFGRIVNFGSIDGQRGRPGAVAACACASAVHGFTKSLAMEGGRSGITVNTLAVGGMDEAAALVGRKGEPADIARTVAFLCSDNAALLTGATISVNGGQHMF